MQTLKDAAKGHMDTPSSSLAADALKGLELADLQAFPSLRALQQTVNFVRKVDVGPGPDREPKDIVLVIVGTRLRQL